MRNSSLVCKLLRNIYIYPSAQFSGKPLEWNAAQLREDERLAQHSLPSLRQAWPQHSVPVTGTSRLLVIKISYHSRARCQVSLR